MLKNGFYTAVGTPLDPEGNIIEESLIKQIDDQIEAGASGILLFGTMGIGGCIKTSQFKAGVDAAISVVKKRCTLLVGASENSISRVKEKIDVLNESDCDGIVMTPMYYLSTGEDALVNFFRQTARLSSKDYYLYDHLPITKHKITFDIVKDIMDEPNLKGIKSGDLVLIKQLNEAYSDEGFSTIFSNSDLFDIAHTYGIRRNLDGIFACMPKSTSKAYAYFETGDIENAKFVLKQMMDVRDKMLNMGIWAAFTYAMNLLGYKGSFSPDYERKLREAQKQQVKEQMKKLKEV
jgi:4-hydroxy-tetrahydrodipicolinate synthase